ncbi:hypothetical protein ABZV77_12660 [Streptomyces sp. NPDC004732]|uniref:hypothetical protein n=1 Tax=Streptomyces sp. NPDC004732 TaxID=3154290 RepID=UPI0033AB3642
MMSGTPLGVVAAALKHITESVDLCPLPRSDSHTPIRVSGLELPDVTRAFGRALVGVLAGAVRTDLRLAARLLATGIDGRAEFVGNVRTLIGVDNDFGTAEAILFRDTKRNAWIAEGVLHILLAVQDQASADLLGGRIQALRKVHTRPTQQGFDAVALYQNGDELSIAIGESKASREDGSGQLTEATQIFKHIDLGEYGLQLRQELEALSEHLSDDLAAQVASAVLKRLCYVPSIVHEKEFDPGKRRETLARLRPAVDRKRLLVIQLQDFYGFFDSVADTMRDAVNEIVV